MSEGYKFVTDFASEKITAVVVFIDTLFAKEATVETLCVGTQDDRTCITKAQLDELLQAQGVTSSQQSNASDSCSSAKDNSSVNDSNGGDSERTDSGVEPEEISVELIDPGIEVIEEDAVSEPPASELCEQQTTPITE